MRTPILILVSLCLAARLAFFCAARPWDETVERETVVRSDAAGYHGLALNLLSLHRFSADRERPETLRTPLYPAFIAGFYAAWGPEPWGVLLAQIALAGLSCGVLYRTTRRGAGPRAAFLAGLFFALDPTLVFSSVTLMSETLFVCLCVWACHSMGIVIERGLGRASRLPLASAAFAFGLAALVRPIALYLPALIAVFLLVSQRAALRDAARSAVLFTSVFAATLAPWAARNLALCGSFAISSSGAFNLLVLDVGPMEMQRRGQTMDEVKRALLAEADASMRADGRDPSRANGFEKAPYQSRLALQYISERPLAFAKFYALGLFTSFASLGTRGYADWLGLRDVHDDRFDLRAYPNPFDMLRAALAHKTPAELAIGAVLAGFLLVFYPCIAAGALAARARPERGERSLLWLCAGLAVYFVVLTGPAGLSRFRVAATPFLDILAGVGAAQLYALARRRAPGSIGAPARLPLRSSPTG